MYSNGCTRQVRRAFDADLPLIAAIHYHVTEGFIGEVKKRDTEQFEVTEGTQDTITATLTKRLLSTLPSLLCLAGVL